MSGSWFVAVLAILAFLAPPAFAEETVKVSGTGGAIGILKLLGESFGKKHPGIKVTVFPSTGSTGGIKAVTAGKLDIAASSRRIRDNEKVPGLREKPCMRTPFIFATTSINQADGLALSEIRDIYSGRKTTWPDGRKISLVIRPATDAFTGYLENLAPGMKDAVASSEKREDLFIGITDQDAADQIERTAGSFGVTSYSLVVMEKRKIKPLAVDGISPADRSGVNGRYPYYLTFYLVYLNGRDTGAVKTFLDFVDSREGEQILRMGGSVPVGKTRGNS